MRFTAGSVLPRQEKISLPVFLTTGRWSESSNCYETQIGKVKVVFVQIFVQGDFFVNN